LNNKIISISKVIIDKVSINELTNYPKAEIQNYKNILSKLNITSDFNENLKEKKENLIQK